MPHVKAKVEEVTINQEQSVSSILKIFILCTCLHNAIHVAIEKVQVYLISNIVLTLTSKLHIYNCLLSQKENIAHKILTY